MTGENRPRPIPVEEFPDPVLAYAVEDEEPVVSGANDAFRSAFGTVPDETPLVAALDRAGIAVPDDAEEIATRARRGEQFRTTVEGPDPATDDVDATTPHLLRVVPGADDDGHLVFSDLGGVVESGATDPGADRVASVVSHDLRNPLDVAKARLRAGRETGDDDHFDRVASAHDRMERIVRDVLTLARGEDAIDPTSSVDLGPLAREAWETVETEDATLAVDGPLPTVTADEDRARRLFENLFRNSVEHGSTNSRTGDPSDDCVEHGSTDGGSTTDETGESPDGDPAVRVGHLGSDPETGFYVADDGPGIPEGQRRAAFEPGYSTHDHGTGLGLAIVERIATAHGWSVSATAAGDGGARIEVRVTDGE